MRLRAVQLGALFAAVSVVSLGLLAYFSISLATDAVKRDAKERMSLTAALSAEGIHQELDGLKELVESYAGRPSLIAALEDGRATPRERAGLRRHLLELNTAREGTFTTFVADLDGKLIDVVPETPSIVGKDFSFRDWYRGVARTADSYVSHAYRTQASGNGLVVAVATYVRDGANQVGILVAAYKLDHFQTLAQLATAQRVTLMLTDQRGMLLATRGRTPTELVSRRADPRVATALAGFSGTVELDTDEGRSLSAYAPVVPDIGWTVTASVPTGAAYAGVGKLRSAVLSIAGVLGLIVLGSLFLLVRILHQRQKAEEDARRLANINRAVLDATRDAIFLIDSEGKLLLKNAALDRLTEDPEAWTKGNVYDRLLAGAERMVNPEEWRSALERIASNPDLETDVQVQVDSGTTFNIYTAPVGDGAGGLLGRIVVARDKTAEHDAERMKSELVATVSHELRTPLSSIVGFAELLVDRDVSVETRERYIATIDSEARRLMNLVNDFLDLQKLEEEGFTLALEPFELGDVLREQAALFRGQSTNHEIEVVVPDEPLSVLGERDRIVQVVSNLISNAIKYSPAGGRVEIRLEARDSAVRAFVSDEGLGIPADQQRGLFTRFFRVDTSDTREIGGTGLGLALCREIIEAHGGRVGFDSTQGEGSTFWFELPSRQRGSSDGKHRVLVVEDDPAAASLLAEYIGVNGYEVEIVATGEQGLERALADPPSLICLDIALPGDVDGWQLLGRLRERADTAEIPVIVCTGRNGRDRASALGVADFISKPFSQAQIREAVGRLLPEGHGRVLVVDDDPAVRRLVVETLRSEGVELREAPDGEAALEEIHARRPDLVILDLLMPGMDGFEVLERIQADPDTKHVTVLVLTAKSLSAAERQRLSERAVSLLDKNAYSPAELRRLVGLAVGQ